MNADGTVRRAKKIGSGVGGGPSLMSGSYFGRSVAALGDLDGDGITDLAVGADRDNTGGVLRGSVYILFLNADGTAKGSQKIASGIGGAPTLAERRPLRQLGGGDRGLGWRRRDRLGRRRERRRYGRNGPWSGAHCST